MKPFDLEAAKRGEPLVTRDGRKAKFIAYVPECRAGYRLIVKVEGMDYCSLYYDEGQLAGEGKSDPDLFMAPVKREGWINVYPYYEILGLGGVIYPTKEDADKEATLDRIACAHIEWEE